MVLISIKILIIVKVLTPVGVMKQSGTYLDDYDPLSAAL